MIKGTSPPKRIVIGENMKRIKMAAKQVGAKWYQGWKIDPWNPTIAMKRNRAWIIKKMKDGYEIVDIGIDPTRAFRSPFYAMEKQLIAQYLYPITPYGKMMKR
jgi:hypothetical protein